MADRYLQALKSLERRKDNNILSFSDVLTHQLDELASAMVDEKMSDNDYIQLCILYYQRYEKEENKQGMTFCTLRIQQLLSLKKKKLGRKFFSKIHFSSRIDDEAQEFINDKKNFYKKIKDEFKKKCLFVCLGIFIFFLILTVLLFHFYFLLGWILSLLLAIACFFVGQLYLFDRIFDQNMMDIRKKLNSIHAQIDYSIQEA